jgi:hypothetical protein
MVSRRLAEPRPLNSISSNPARGVSIRRADRGVGEIQERLAASVMAEGCSGPWCQAHQGDYLHPFPFPRCFSTQFVAETVTFFVGEQRPVIAGQASGPTGYVACAAEVSSGMGMRLLLAASHVSKFSWEGFSAREVWRLRELQKCSSKSR